MIPDNVTLIVKAPNQQIDDQNIECQSSWTVRQLKGHLEEVYPSKPVSTLFLIYNFIYSYLYLILGDTMSTIQCTSSIDFFYFWYYCN